MALSLEECLGNSSSSLLGSQVHLGDVNISLELSENVNYSSVAAILGCPRENVELSMKEINLRLMKYVLKGIVLMSLDCGEFGYLDVSTNPLKMKLRIKKTEMCGSIDQIAFDEILTDRNSVIEATELIEKSPIECQNENYVDEVEEIDASNCDYVFDTLLEDDMPRFVIRTSKFYNSVDEIDNTTHRHPHTGERRWMNHSCPICRHDQSQFTDLREEEAAKELNIDKRILLHSIQEYNNAQEQNQVNP